MTTYFHTNKMHTRKLYRCLVGFSVAAALLFLAAEHPAIAQKVGEMVVVPKAVEAKIKKEVVDNLPAGSIVKVVVVEGSWCAVDGTRGWISLGSVLSLRDGLKHYSARIAANRKDAESWATRGMIQYELDELDAAFVDMNEALKANSRVASIWHNRGIVLHAMGRYPMAIDDFSEALRLKSNYTRAYHSRGLSYYALGDLEKAILDFTRAIRLDDKEAWFYINRGSAHHAAGNWNEALADYQTAAKLNGKLADPLIGIANVYLDQGDLAKAFAAAQQAVAGNPRNPTALNVRGWVQFKQNQLEPALKDFDAAIAIWPEFSLAHNNRGVVLTDLKRFDEAATSLAKSIALSPETAVTFVNRAQCYFQTGEFAKAWADLEQAQQLDGASIEVIVARTWFLATCPDDALRDVKRAAETWQGLPEDFELDWSAWDVRAATEAAQGEFPAAIASAERALQLAPAHRQEPIRRRLELYRGGQAYRAEVRAGAG